MNVYTCTRFHLLLEFMYVLHSISGQEMVSIMKSVEDLILMGEEVPEEEEEEEKGDGNGEGADEAEESGDEGDEEDDDEEEEEEEDEDDEEYRRRTQ